MSQAMPPSIPQTADKFLHALTVSVLSQDTPNMAISPVSVFYGMMSVVVAATRDSTTHIEVCDVLGLDKDQEDAFLYTFDKIRKGLVQGSEHVQVHMASSLWCKAEINQSFRELCLKKMSMQVGPLDGKDSINAWVQDQTMGMITEVLTKDPEGLALVVNVLFFKGMWTTQFLPQDTYKSKFYVSAESDETKAVPCEMMKQKCNMPYIHFNTLQIVEMSYGDDNRFCAYVILPTPSGLIDHTCVTSLEQTIKTIFSEQGEWENISDCMSTDTLVNLHVPRFTVECQLGLKGTLSAMGMPTAFGPGSSFDRLCGDRLCGDVVLQDVKHVVKIEVNEVGTKAAASTSLKFAPRGRAPPEPQCIDMVVNRPFVFMVYDTVAKWPLFVAKVSTPG
jgi:serine protease inhibitor